MMPNNRRYLFDEPALYRIRVRGELAPDWVSMHCGMEIHARQKKGNIRVSTLFGRLIDQASLIGVLNTLYETGYTLLEVKRLSAPAAEVVSEKPGSD